MRAWRSLVGPGGQCGGDGAPQLAEGGGLGGQAGHEGPDGLGPCGEKRAVREQTSENPAALKA